MDTDIEPLKALRVGTLNADAVRRETYSVPIILSRPVRSETEARLLRQVFDEVGLSAAVWNGSDVLRIRNTTVEAVKERSKEIGRIVADHPGRLAAHEAERNRLAEIADSIVFSEAS